MTSVSGSAFQMKPRTVISQVVWIGTSVSISNSTIYNDYLIKLVYKNKIQNKKYISPFLLTPHEFINMHNIIEFNSERTKRFSN